MKGNNQMSAVLSSLNMPLQINSSSSKQNLMQPQTSSNLLMNLKQQNAFKQYDYPVQQTQAQNQMFQCVLLNLLSGRQQYPQVLAESAPHKNKINLKAKQIQAAAISYKPKSAQSQTNRKIQNFQLKQKANANQNLNSPQQPFTYFSGNSQSSSTLRTKQDNITQQQESNTFNYYNQQLQTDKPREFYDQQSNNHDDQQILHSQKTASSKRIGSGHPTISQHQHQLSQLNQYKRRPMSTQGLKEDQQLRRDEFSNEKEDENKLRNQSKYKRHKEQSKLRQKSKSNATKNLQKSQNQPLNTLSPSEIHSKQVVLSKRSIDSPFQNIKQNQLSTIRNTQESLDNDFTHTLTQNYELQSMFSPKFQGKNGNPLTQSQRFISTQSSNKFNKKQSLQSNIQAFQPRDFFKSPNEDKENIHFNSNQKPKTKSSNLKTKPKILAAQISTDQLFTGDIIQKLKQEVKKQVKKRLEKEQNEQQNKQQKHLASVMPFDMKQKLRQKKLTTIQQSIQQQTINLKQSLEMQAELQKQRQDYEEQKQQRQFLKQKRQEERRENQMCFEILKKSMSNSPLRKKLNHALQQQHQQQQQNLIRIENVDQENKSGNIDLDQDLENLDKIMKHKKKPSKGIIDASQLNQILATKTQTISSPIQNQNMKKKATNSLSPPKRASNSNSPYISPSKKIKMNNQHYEYHPFQRNAYQLKTENTDPAVSSENRHQSIENYLKEQKSKRIKEQKQKDQKESKKLIKLKSQLINLQSDYFKGLQEFKEKQRIINNEKATIEKKRGTSKKRKKSKKGSSKKPQMNIAELIQMQKAQALMSPNKQKIEYNLNMQRNSMPVLTKSPQINVQFRQSFQSPEQYQMLRSYEGPVLYNDARSQNSYSPSQQTSDYLFTQIPKELRLKDRESLISQFTMNTLNTNNITNTNTYSQQDLHQYNQIPGQINSNQPQMQIPLSMRMPNFKKPNLFQSDSQSQLQDVKSFKTVKNSLRNNQGKQLIDLKSDQAVKMFSEFARIRKELEKQVHNKKDDTQNVNLLEAVAVIPLKKKKQSNSKKRPKTSNLPLKITQVPFLKQQYNNQVRKSSNVTEYPPLQQNIQPQVLDQHNFENNYEENNQLIMNYQIMQEQRIQQSKNQIIDKIQQVQEKLQNNFKLRQNNNSQSQQSSNQTSSYQINHQVSNSVTNPKSSQQQTIMLSGNNSNVIQEEESKDIEITSYASPQSQRKIESEQSHNDMNRMPQILSMGEDMSQIVKKTDEDEQITALNEDNSIKNNNTTMLLKKMYSIEDRVREISHDKLNEAATLIQKSYRGFIFRKIMKEKLRIDREFRMLRQKYEVKSNPTSNQTLSSLAFSQSKGPQSSNQFRFGSQKSKPWSPFNDQNQLQGSNYYENNLLSNFALQKLQQQQQQYQQLQTQQLQIQSQPTNEIFKSQSQESLDSDMQTFHMNQNQSDQFYKFDDLGNKGMAVSVFKSPSIQEQTEPKDSIIQNQMKAVFDYQPTKLQFQDSQINVNLMKESELTSIPVIVRELKDSGTLYNNFINEDIKENEKQSDRSFMNDENSQRSIMPIEEDSPFIMKNIISDPAPQLKDENQVKQQINFYNDQSSNNQENEDSNIMNQHAEYLDSPLKLNDLSLNKRSNNSPQIKMKLKRNIPPRPQTKNEEINFRREAHQMKERATSSIEERSQSSQSQIFSKNKPGLDISSLINYGEEEKQSKNRSNTRSSKLMKQSKDTAKNQVNDDEIEIKTANKDFIKKIPSSISNNYGSVVSICDRSPTINADDLSPSNQHMTYISGSQKQKKDDSVSINTSIFEKNSFQIFQRDKQVNVFKVESEIEHMIKELNKALKQKVKIKKQELKDGELSVRTYNKKKGELEKWVEKEKREISMTKKHFKQGCMGFMRLSSLMENFSKEQDRMKDAVSSIRKKGNSGIMQQNNSMNMTHANQNSALRRSHSFDSEINKQYDEVQQNLFGGGSNKDPSEGFNTASGRRLSSGLASSFATNNGINIQRNDQTDNNQNQLDDLIQPLYQIEEENNRQKLFDYNSRYDVDSQNINKFDDDSEDEKFLEIKSNKQLSELALSNQVSQNFAEANLNKKNSDKESVNEFSSLEDLSMNHAQIQIHEENSPVINDNLNSQHSQPKLSLPLSANSLVESGNNPYQLSDTPLYQQNDEGKLSFPDSIKSMEDMEKLQDQRVDLLVEEILENILLRDIRERLFPRRALSKLLSQKPVPVQQQIEVRRIDLQVNRDKNAKQDSQQQLIHGISPDLQDQIKVLDNILEELDNSQNQIKQQPKIQIIEDGDNSSKSRNSPEAVNDLNDPKVLDCFPMPSNLEELEKSPIIDEKEILEPDESPSKKGIETGIKQVNTYMQEIFDRLKTDKPSLTSVLDNISQPLYKDPLMILAHLQNSIPEPPLTISENEDSDNPQSAPESAIPFQQSVLSVDLYLDIEKDRRGGLSISQMKDSFHGEDSNSQSFVNEMENIHNKAIFDAVNEAMDGFRPYGLRGPPLPWSKNNKTLTFKFGKEETFDYLLQKVKYRVLDWAHISAGTMAKSMMKNKQMTQRDRDHLELIREERLARILIQEAEENEPLWTDYEYEETQTKIDVADLVLEHMINELVDIMRGNHNQKQQNSDENQAIEEFNLMTDMKESVVSSQEQKEETE